LGPLFIDLNGAELDPEERELLGHPLVGGVILFSRNYHERAQLQALIHSIRRASARPLLIAVDHEGGRVQRFRDGFSRIPAMGTLTQTADSPEQAAQHAEEMGWLMAAELRAMDIDLSFAPVLDLDRGSEVIGDRAFGAQAQIVCRLAGAFIRGMHAAGMAATAKHFPGHGSVRADSHVAAPVDKRDWETIRNTDLVPFVQLIEAGLVDAVMPAHVTYPAVDADNPAGFSATWIRQILKQQLRFDGLVFSDDLAMAGAGVAGGFAERATAALAAGCDFLLACNQRSGTVEILDRLPQDLRVERGSELVGRRDGDWRRLTGTLRWQHSHRLAKQLVDLTH